MSPPSLFRRHALCGAVLLALAIVTAQPVQAQSVTGAVAGQADAGTQVTITNTQTGFTRTVTAGADGTYRLSLLPPGNYTLQASRDGQPQGDVLTVAVTLGNTTTIHLGSSGGATNLGAVQVVGSRMITPVDVASTESASNIRREEIARIPVDDTVSAVALLAPGVSAGSASFGGISFGGSSVAENAFYINGLNVTDFYNRVGFSEAPFAFYKEFQVKTGGYSVEFGRTTGGVVNALARTGSNEFRYGAELTIEPSALRADAEDRYRPDGDRYISASEDNSSLYKLDLYASGPIVQDRLFFFAMYEARDFRDKSTNDDGSTFEDGDAGNGFWGGTLDWYITDRNILSLMAFSNKNSTTTGVYGYDWDSGERSDKTNEIYSDTGGRNWNLTWTSHFTDALSLKLMYGRSNRQAFTRSLLDLACNRVVRENAVPRPGAGIPLGCTTNSSVFSRQDEREAARADFEWSLGDHLLRFGLDREINTSDHEQYYAGPGALFYNVYAGSNIPNPPGGSVPAGYSGYVRARRNEIHGVFESTNSAWYIEDNWNVTDNLLLNIGLRQEAFDNRDGDGNSYIEMKDMLAPRFGFSWDFNGDGRAKLFGNVGRYFLPVANVINIKQAGGLLDERTYYAFGGWELRENNGNTYAFPILGPQIGTVDTSQGDGTVGDLRSEVDRDMDPVYQDEVILGMQAMINDTWSWGVRGIYRKLHNAIDDMNITSTAACGDAGAVGWVMANAGKDVTVWGDTDCNGSADGWVTIDTSKEGWALYDDIYTYRGGRWVRTDSQYKGQRGWNRPKRSYKALEFQVDRAWDDTWAFNASYTLSWSEGNAEGPVNTDTNFGDTGRTENFDDPWVNLRGYGPLANDHRHQIKLRGTYALDEHWHFGASLDARSGGPITAFGVGNPYDAESYHSYYLCVQNCLVGSGVTAQEGATWSTASRVYEWSERGGRGRMPWTFNLGASVSYFHDLGWADLKVKLAVFNLLNQQRTVRVEQELEPSLGTRDPYFGYGLGFQSPRYAQLSVALDF